jgi:hypothetical protein
VRDFRPLSDDNLDRVFGFGPEEVSEELVELLMEKLGLAGAETALADVDFRNVVTPQNVQEVLVKIAKCAADGAEEETDLSHDERALIRREAAKAVRNSFLRRVRRLN